MTPASLYTSSTREYPKHLPQPHYPEYFEVGKVSVSGVMYWRNKMVYISHLLKDENIGLEEVDNGIWDVYFVPVKIGHFDERQFNNDKARDYISIKV